METLQPAPAEAQSHLDTEPIIAAPEEIEIESGLALVYNLNGEHVAFGLNPDEQPAGNLSKFMRIQLYKPIHLTNNKSWEYI
ncbi:TPA: hypothetical protein EYO12_04060 [Candidatus Saccharibacteria bacterium]|nr:hypothetical protein [Candidatus Saccharibacteria bacterium]HIO87790.1 hypothetical protein [Candidatus Saccharibacteria bacterium]